MPWAPIRTKAAPRDATIGRIAAAHDATARQVALAWLLARSPVMLPIPGTGSVEHLDENLQARALVLSAAEIAEINHL